MDRRPDLADHFEVLGADAYVTVPGASTKLVRVIECGREPISTDRFDTGFVVSQSVQQFALRTTDFPTVPPETVIYTSLAGGAWREWVVDGPEVERDSERVVVGCR